jgi:hypothetical protein
MPALVAKTWPAPVRWMDTVTRSALCVLELLVLRSRGLQRFVLRRHATAFLDLTEWYSQRRWPEL